MSTLAAYVTDHGFGHAVRTAEVVAAALARAPEVVVHVRTTAPEWLFPHAPGRLFLHPVATDVGMVQRHSLAVDVEATAAALDALAASWSGRLEAEKRWLRAVGARCVVADIPPLAIAAAAEAGVPAIAVGNFSWDWIYAGYGSRDARFVAHARRAAECYARAAMLLRLPFHGDMGAFTRVADVPLIARRAPLGGRRARAALGLPPDRPLVLLSFGGLGYAELDAGGLGEIDDVDFATTEALRDRPPNVHRVDRRRVDYVALLAACDAVVTKPGWGIVAASLVNGVRVLYTSRGDFPEYPILVAALEAHGTASFVAPQRLAAGAIGDELRRLLARGVGPSPLRADGAERVADRALEHLR